MRARVIGSDARCTSLSDCVVVTLVARVLLPPCGVPGTDFMLWCAVRNAWRPWTRASRPSWTITSTVGVSLEGAW